MEISKIIETNPTLVNTIQSIGTKLLGRPDERTQINRSFLAIYLINIIILHESKLSKAYETIGKENALIALHNTETLLEDIEANFFHDEYQTIIQDLSSFLISLSASTLNNRDNLY